MPSLPEVGIDSQCLTYVIDALGGAPTLASAIAEQGVALVRIYLYTRGTLWLTPTGEQEYKRMRDSQRRAKHANWNSVLFGTRPLGNPAAVSRRAAELHAFHSRRADCRVLAEAEDIGLDVLLSFDARFVKRLRPQARLNLTEPSSYWQLLGVPRGAKPDKVPTPDNPLAGQGWWHW